METWLLEMLPRVPPPRMSERLAKCWQGTCAASQTFVNRAEETPSVVYFWFALCLMTTPPFMYTRFWASYSSGWFGCRACALSADAMKPEAIAARTSPAERPSASPDRVSTSPRKVESAPCLEVEPTSSLSKTLYTGMKSAADSEAKKPARAVQAHSRSSIRPQEKNSFSAPQMLPGVRSYRKRSLPRICCTETPTVSAIS